MASQSAELILSNMERPASMVQSFKQVSVDIDANVELESFPGAYSQILTNLVLNSLVHGFDDEIKGNIRISARQLNQELILEYHDSGKGIPESILSKIFDPIFTSNKKGSSGICVVFVPG